MDNFSSRNKLIIGILLLSALIIGGSFLYSKFGKNLRPSTSPLQSANNQTGVAVAQKMLDENPQFIKRAVIQQQIEGVLKAVNGNSWTVEAGGKSLTVTSESTNKVLVTKLPKTASSSSTQAILPTEIKPTEMQIGSLISIGQIIDWQTGKVTIVGITVLPSK